MKSSPLSLLAVFSIACGSPRVKDGVCTVSLEEYVVSVGDHQTYDEAVAAARGLTRCGFEGNVIGTCGDLRYVLTSYEGAFVRYYDADGRLVAGTRPPPLEACGMEPVTTVNFGAPITCTRTVGEVLCTASGPK